MSVRRVQVTLFVDPQDAAPLEELRARWNPAQRRLIAAHVTLCREDELTDLERVRRNLAGATAGPVTLAFAPPVRFADGRGCQLPATGDLGGFHRLRSTALAGGSTPPRDHAPHITLVHPRNASCTDHAFAAIASAPRPQTLTFTRASIIEQHGDEPWRILDEIVLAGAVRPTAAADRPR